MNMGVAVEDVVTAKEIYEAAKTRKIGAETSTLRLETGASGHQRRES